MESLGLLILRLGSGGIMLFAHGWGKMMGFSKIAPNFPDPIGVGGTMSLGLAVFSEVFCAVALMIGLGTRFVSFPLFITMIVAAFIVHGDDPFKGQEKAIVFALMYLVLMITGGGKYSVDNFIFKKK